MNGKEKYTKFIASKNYNSYSENNVKIPILEKFEIFKNANLEYKKENVSEVKKLLKRLVERNVDTIYESLIVICYTDPLSVIHTFCENILFSTTIQFLLEKLVTKFPIFFQEVFYYYVIEKYKAFDDYTQNAIFTRSFVNFTNFIAIFYKIDNEPINKYIIESLEDKKYIYIGLLEKVLTQNSDISKKCKKYLEKGYFEGFKELIVNKKLRIEIGDRYYCLCNFLYGKRRKTNNENSLKGLCECFPSEIKEFAYQFDLKSVLKEFYNLTFTDYDILKTIIHFLRARDDYNDVDILNKINEYIKNAKYDQKLLIDSFVALIKNRAKQKRTKIDNYKQNEKRTEENMKDAQEGKIKDNFADKSKTNIISITNENKIQKNIINTKRNYNESTRVIDNTKIQSHTYKEGNLTRHYNANINNNLYSYEKYDKTCKNNDSQSYIKNTNNKKENQQDKEKYKHNNLDANYYYHNTDFYFSKNDKTNDLYPINNNYLCNNREYERLQYNYTKCNYHDYNIKTSRYYGQKNQKFYNYHSFSTNKYSDSMQDDKRSFNNKDSTKRYKYENNYNQNQKYNSNNNNYKND